MQNCPRQLAMQYCVLYSFVRCGTSKQIEKKKKSFFSEWTNNIKDKINNRIEVLNNTLHKYKQFDALSSPDINAALENLHKGFVVVPIDKATGKIALICKRFYASVIAKELGLGNNNTTDTYNPINNSSTDTIINSNINDLKSKFGIDDVNMENHCLPHMYWLPKMHKSPVKARFIIASPKSSIKPLSQAITSAFRLFFIDKFNLTMINVDFSQA